MIDFNNIYLMRVPQYVGHPLNRLNKNKLNFLGKTDNKNEIKDINFPKYLKKFLPVIMIISS